MTHPGDVILKYTADEARQLKATGELPETVMINDTANEDDGSDGGFDFHDGSDSEDGEVDVDAI